MKKLATLTLCAVMVTMAFAVIPSASAITITNPGFETGNKNGWWSSGYYGYYATVRTYHYTSYPYYQWLYPTDGNYMLRLYGMSPYYYGGWYNGYYQRTMARQYITVSAGEVIQGSACFDGYDYMPYNDYAYVRIKTTYLSTIAQPWYASISMYGNYGLSGWQQWSYQFTSGGTYILEYGAANMYDTAMSPTALFDMGEGPPKFPELVVVDSTIPGDDVSAGGLFQASVTVENIGEADAEISSIEWAGDCVYSQAMPGEVKTIAVGDQATYAIWGVPSPRLETGDTCEVEFGCYYNSESGDPVEETLDIEILNRRFGGVRADYMHGQDAAFHGLALTIDINNGNLPEGLPYLIEGNAHFMAGEYKQAKNDYVKCPGSPGLGNTCGGRGAFWGSEGNGLGGK